MSAPINDGGPAFPPGDGSENGMTLRDYFAGQALAAMPAGYMVEQPDHVIARFAYSLADAMLAAQEATK
jgi:hypothetical protein